MNPGDAQIMINHLKDELIERIDVARSNELAIKELTDQLNHELAVNDNLQDLNIELKGKVGELKERLKVHPLPSSLRQLREQVSVLEYQNNEIRRALLHSINLLPDSRMLDPHKTELRKIAEAHGNH